MYTLDIESDAIPDNGPVLPRPVGLAVRNHEGHCHYYAFGHPFGNNSTFEQVSAFLHQIWDQPILTHNGLAFDIPVLQHWFGLPARDPELTHDTLILAYLHNQHARSLSLKDLANDLLGIPPDEQRELQTWIISNVPECRTARQAGAYISRAPGPLVAPYAIGDTTRTYALWQRLQPTLAAQRGAYQREIKLGALLADIQLRGVLVDTEALENDYRNARAALDKLDLLIKTKLNSPSLNLDSPKELAGALVAAGYDGFMRTEKGALSTNKESLSRVLRNDPQLQNALHSRATYATLTGTFLGPWLEQATKHHGRLHARYNQVRNPDGKGTRTGRLSSSNPNLQNVANNLGLDYFGDPFPEMRGYLLPEAGHVWVTADLKAQEPRLAAHFEGGLLCRAFNEDPNLDPYLFVSDICGVTRKQAKTIFLGLLYAMGAATMAEGLGCSVNEASALRDKIKGALPDVVQLDYGCKRRFNTGGTIKTLGGRIYHCEPPSNGRVWAYKALNTLIQGSAADQTKSMLVYTANRLLPGERILGTVHDEISVSCPPERVTDVIKLLLEGANTLPCDVPMTISAGFGQTFAEAGKQ